MRVMYRSVVGALVAKALEKAEVKAQHEQAARDVAKAEYEAEMARVSTIQITLTEHISQILSKVSQLTCS